MTAHAQVATADQDFFGVSESTLSTIDHLARIAGKLQVLTAALSDGFDQLCTAVGREHLSYEMATTLELFIFADRVLGAPVGIRMPGARIAESMDERPATMRYWSKNWPDNSGRRFDGILEGGFPIFHQFLPNVPAVYVLMDDDSVVQYIGSSIRVRDRLKAHAKSEKAPFISKWQAILCQDEEEARDLEADLIFQHQPPMNKVGLRSRAAPKTGAR